MDYTTIKRLYSILIVSLFLVEKIHVFAAYESYDIYVASGLPNNDIPLKTQCQSSKGADLGERLLRVGEEYSWHLRMDLQGTIKYYCFFWWGEKTMHDL